MPETGARRRPRRASSTCAPRRTRNRACRRAKSGATRRRSATCSRSRPIASTSSARICARERCPFAVLGVATEREHLDGARPAVRQQAGRHGPRCAARQAAAHAARREAHDAPRGQPLDLSQASTSPKPACACCAIRQSRTRPSSSRIGDRTVGGLCSRDPFVGPWQVPVADCAVTLLGYRTLCRRSLRHGRAHAARAHRRARPRGAWRWARRSPISPRAPVTDLVAREAVGQLDGGGGSRGRGRRAVRHGARGGAGTLPGAGHRASRSARIRCRCARPGRRTGGDKQVVAPLSLIVSAFAPVRRCAPHAHAAAAHATRATPNCC